MTLDEAIKHCLEVAEAQEEVIKSRKIYVEVKGLTPLDECRKIAADHRQLAEWLKELQENRKLLEALKVNKYITKKDAINALLEKGQHSNRYKLGETWELNFLEIQEAIDELPAKLIKKIEEE